VVWFDISAGDIERAIAFYEGVLQCELSVEEYSNFKMGVSPHVQGEVAGCIYDDGDHVPSEGGLLVYFNCDGRLDDAVSRVEGLGGTVPKPVHVIGPHGSRAVVPDSEGNRIVLHATATS
jgi:predicted enzyme related to lactoylglutathione lyase